MLKKILFPIFSVFLAYQSVKLVTIFFHNSPSDFSFQLVVILAFLLNLFITGVFAFTGFVYPTNKILPNSYYSIKNPNALNKLYNLIGVEYFKILLLITFWGKEKNKKKYFNGTKSGLINFDFQTRQSEFGHFGAFVVILLVSIVLLSNGHKMAFLLTSIINVLSNFYPIILQRKHRMTIQKLTNRI